MNTETKNWSDVDYIEAQTSLNREALALCNALEASGKKAPAWPTNASGLPREQYESMNFFVVQLRAMCGLAGVTVAMPAAAPASTQAQPAAQPKTETKAQTATEALLAANGVKTVAELQAANKNRRDKKRVATGLAR